MKEYLNSVFDLSDGRIASALDEVNLWSAPFALKLLDMIDYKPGIRALDIGFGTGFPMIELAMRLGADSQVYGIDPWKAGIERAKQKIATMGVTNVTIVEGIAEDLPFDDCFFNLIVSNNGINNVADIPGVFSECYRTLKPGSQFVFSMNLRYSMNEFYEVFRQALRSAGLEGQLAVLESHIHDKRKPVAGIREMLNSSGFEIRNIYHDSFRLRYATGTAFLSHYFIRLAFLPEWIKIVPNDKKEELFSSIEEALNAKAQSSGGLALTIPFAVFDCVKK